MNICVVYMNMFARFDEIHSRTLQDIKKYAHTKAIKNYKGKYNVTLKELAPSPYSFIINICVAYMNVFRRF